MIRQALRRAWQRARARRTHRRTWPSERPGGRWDTSATAASRTRCRTSRRLGSQRRNSDSSPGPSIGPTQTIVPFEAGEPSEGLGSGLDQAPPATNAALEDAEQQRVDHDPDHKDDDHRRHEARVVLAQARAIEREPETRTTSDHDDPPP